MDDPVSLRCRNSSMSNPVILVVEYSPLILMDTLDLVVSAG